VCHVGTRWSTLVYHAWDKSVYLRNCVTIPHTLSTRHCKITPQPQPQPLSRLLRTGQKRASSLQPSKVFYTRSAAYLLWLVLQCASDLCLLVLIWGSYGVPKHPKISLETSSRRPSQSGVHATLISSIAGKHEGWSHVVKSRHTGLILAVYWLNSQQ
jgi:hypothetical protein